MREEAKMHVRLPGRPQGACPNFTTHTPYMEFFAIESDFIRLHFFPKPNVRSTPDLTAGSSNRNPVHIYGAKFYLNQTPFHFPLIVASYAHHEMPARGGSGNPTNVNQSGLCSLWPRLRIHTPK